ncbi:phage tail tip lysozyme, partial [Methylobacterium sp. WL120]|uniref:phage tail tip lysozyme n=1 Tax=Methylobacterium sp. WL120 TaxID=2603887 RepID=UPI00165010DC
GGGGGASGLGGNFFNPGTQVPGWYGKGSGGGGGGSDASGGPAKFGMGAPGAAFGAKAPGIVKNLMADFNLTKEQAAGIVGNLGHESAGFTAYQEANPRGGGRGGAGWAQWTGPRRRQFEAWAAAKGLDPKSDAASYGFLKHELNTTESGALAAVRKQSSVQGATVAFENGFERAGVKNWGSRMKYANQAFGSNLNGVPQVASNDAMGTVPVSNATGAAANAVDIAGKYLGKNEHTNRRELSQFVGHDVAGNINAWCARFVNSSLEAAGTKGTGSAMANSFLRWGKGVDADAVQKGDVAVEHRNKGVNAGGGHVGIATGNKRMRNGEMEIETISGNHGDAVVKDWTKASKLAIRRDANEASAKAVAAVNNTVGAAKAAQSINLGDGMTSSGWKKAGSEGAAAGVPLGSPAERAAAGVPMPSAGSPGAAGKAGGGGRGGPVNIHVNGAGENPEALANKVQRRVTEAWNHRSHDLEPELT